MKGGTSSAKNVLLRGKGLDLLGKASPYKTLVNTPPPPQEAKYLAKGETAIRVCFLVEAKEECSRISRSL